MAVNAAAMIKKISITACGPQKARERPVS